MGAEPWLVRKPFIVSPARVLQRFYDEILKETHDWPEIRVGDTADIFVLTPLEEDLVLDLFGTKEPESKLSSTEIEVMLDNVWEDLPRGGGHFILLHRDGNPVEVCFFGYSLD